MLRQSRSQEGPSSLRAVDWVYPQCQVKSTYKVPKAWHGQLSTNCTALAGQSAHSRHSTKLNLCAENQRQKLGRPATWLGWLNYKKNIFTLHAVFLTPPSPQSSHRKARDQSRWRPLTSPPSSMPRAPILSSSLLLSATSAPRSAFMRKISTPRRRHGRDKVEEITKC